MIFKERRKIIYKSADTQIFIRYLFFKGSSLLGWGTPDQPQGIHDAVQQA